ncbi:MAG: hypothetical protein U9Q27_00050, partial [Patescibacteria group bacterium]|nr:hypothetical protein [Patescibacteria group bacterium]
MGLNFWFKKAIDRVKEESFNYENAWGSLDDVNLFASLYQESIEDKKIVLVDREQEKALVLDYFTRFSENYLKRVRRKLWSISKKKFRYASHLTLTIDPKFFSSLKQAWRGIQQRSNILLTRIRKKYPRIKFLKTAEFQKNGAPHLHVLLLNAPYIPHEELEAMWKLGFISIRQVSVKKGLNYIIKYITKADEQNTNLLWALRARCYSCSRGLLDNYKTNSNS